MSAARSLVALFAGLIAASCVLSPEDKLATLGLSPTSQAALAQLRFVTLQVGDRVDAEDLVLCGERDRAVLGFSRQQVVAYLGLDADWLVPELFETRAEEALLAVPPRQLARVRLPRGIGSTGNPPPAFVREVAGYPLVSRDLGALLAAFAGEEELFAVRREPVANTSVALPAPDTARPWRLGVTVFPRMGPQPGVMIAEVEPQSPAALAGLDKGDRILSLDDRPLRSFTELKRAVSESTSNCIRLQILKKGEKKPAVVELRLTAGTHSEAKITDNK